MTNPSRKIVGAIRLDYISSYDNRHSGYHWFALLECGHTGWFLGFMPTLFGEPPFTYGEVTRFQHKTERCHACGATPKQIERTRQREVAEQRLKLSIAAGRGPMAVLTEYFFRRQ